MPSGGSDRPRQIDALAAEVLGQHCDVLARAVLTMPAASGSSLGLIAEEPQVGGIPKRNSWRGDTCGLIQPTQQSSAPL
jgi:hypothetical protein